MKLRSYKKQQINRKKGHGASVLKIKLNTVYAEDTKEPQLTVRQ